MGNLNEFFQRWKAKAAQRREQGDYVDVKPIPPASPVPEKKPASQQGWWLHRLRPGARREEQLAALQTGYGELLDLIRTIREHLDRQNTNQEQQTEVLSLIRQQMESGHHRDQQMVESIARFNRTLSTLDESNRNSAQTVAGLVEHSRGSQEMLRTLLDRSEKRMMAVTLVLGLVALLSVLGFLYVGMKGPPFSNPEFSAARAGGPVILETLSSPAPVAPEIMSPPEDVSSGPEEMLIDEPGSESPPAAESSEPILTPPDLESPNG